MCASDAFAHNPDGQRHQGELIGPPLSIHAANRAAINILLQVEADTFLFIARENLLAEHLLAVRRGDDHKIVAANVPNKIITIAIFIYHPLANTPYEKDQAIASQKAINIVERLEVVQIYIEHAPGGCTFHFILNCMLKLQPAG